MTALAAMLIYTGFRLAHPREFLHVFKVGPEQFLIYVTTIIAVLATDLLVGIAIGIGLKALIHIVNGVPLQSLFRPYLDVVEEDPQTYRIHASHSAVFSNWIPFRRQIVDAGLVHRKNVVIDLSNTKLVDHTVMEKLHELERDFHQDGLRLEVIGLDNHRPLSDHPHAARRKRAVAM
jgi:MFS superfamily sulfate permease-like transporter